MRSLEVAKWPEEHVGVGNQLIRLIRARRLRYGAPHKRPARIRYHQVVNPESGLHVVLRSFHYSDHDHHA